jgi:hypothetical protein
MEAAARCLRNWLQPISHCWSVTAEVDRRHENHKWGKHTAQTRGLVHKYNGVNVGLSLMAAQKCVILRPLTWVMFRSCTPLDHTPGRYLGAS